MKHAILLALIWSACASAQPFDKSKLIDLTYPFDENTVYWPTAKPFQWHKDAWGKSPAGYWYTSGSFSSSEHLGTHMDSPIHFGENQATTDQVPIQKLVGPVAVTDVAAACARNRDYLVTPVDIAAWEKQHGRIPAGAIVLVRTGWGKFWPDRKRYLGSDKPGDTANLHFPGISKESAAVLRDRKVSGIGIDTASIDHGPSTDFQTHRILNGAGIYGLENVAYLEKVPATGATLIALPMKIKGGTGGPVRIVALLP